MERQQQEKVGTLDVTSTSFDNLAKLCRTKVIGVDSWVQLEGSDIGTTVSLYGVQITQDFFVHTKKGPHNGRAGDYIIENVRQERWVIPRSVWRALYES